MDEPVRHMRAGDAGDQAAAPPDRNVLEDDQVNGQCAQARADAESRVRDSRRAGRDVLLPAAAPRPVQVVLDPPRRHLRQLQLLRRPGDAQVRRARQVRAARARPGRVTVPDLIRLRPAHRRARRTRLLAALAYGLPLRRAPLLARQRAARLAVAPGRHRGIAAVPRHHPLQPRHSVPQLRDLRVPRRTPSAPWLGRRRIRHKPPSSEPAQSKQADTPRLLPEDHKLACRHPSSPNQSADRTR
jgi:hypothetical protein